MRVVRKVILEAHYLRRYTLKTHNIAFGQAINSVIVFFTHYWRTKPVLEAARQDQDSCFLLHFPHRRMSLAWKNCMNWNLFQRQSFKSRVTLTTALVFMLILWSLALYGSKILRANLVQLLADQQLSAASYVASDINGQFKDRFEGLELISHAIDAPLINTPLALQRFLEERFVLHSLFNGGVIVYDLDYKAIADVPVIGRTGVDYSDRDSVVKAIREGKSSISRPAIGKKLQTPSFLLTVPIHDAQGHVMGALSGVVDLGKPNFLTRITEHTYGKTGGYVLVAPQHRLIVAATDKSRIMEELPAPGVSPLIDSFIQGYEGTDVFVNPVGVEVMASAKGIPVAGWYVVAILPTEEAFAPIKDLQRQMFLAAILLTLVTGISTWWILRRELAPLLSAANTLASMSVSDTSHHFLPITRQDEIGDLIGSLNMLLQTLRLREASLKDSEFRWKFAIEGSGDGLWDWDVDKGTVWFSKRWKEMLGFDDDGISNHPDEWEKRIHPDDIPDVMAKVQSHLDGQLAMFTAEHRLMCKDGNYKWVLGRGMVVNRSEDGKPLRMIGTNTDISARKIAEEGLIEAERKFRALFEMSPIGVAYHQMIYDDAGKPVDYYFLDANESYLELTGADPRGRTVLQAFPGIENDSFDWIGTFGHVALTGEPIRFEQHFKSNNRWYDCVAYQYKPDQFVVAFMEITKRKQVEFALRESEERFRTLMENIPGIAVQGYALDGTVTFWNHASEVLYGHTASEALGAKLLDLIIPADMHEGVKQSIQTMINTGEPIPASELHLQRKDGSLVPVFSSHALLHPFGRPAEMFCLDIDLT